MLLRDRDSFRYSLRSMRKTDVKQIKLTQGYFAMVDDADYPALSAYSWRVSICKYGCYAVRTQRRDEVSAYSERKNVYMHKQIMSSCPDDMVVHHRDENGLNNQRENLEIVTMSKNGAYYHAKSKTSDNESGCPF